MNTTVYIYKAGRLIKETDYLGQVKTYTLDPNGNLIAKIDFNGNRISYGYDKLNRMIESVFPDGTKKSFSYDPVGNMTSAVNDLVTEKFYYDELSRLLKAETIGLKGIGDKLVEFSYDKAGNTTKITTWEKSVPSKVYYAYDNLNRLAKVTLPDKNIVEFKYDALNRIVERSNSNRTGTIYSYTARGEVESIVNYKDHWRGPDQVQSSYGYIYNASGQRIFQVEGDGQVTAYNYDPAGRIKEVYYPFVDAKKAEDLKERYFYGLFPDPKEPFKVRFKVPGLRYDEHESLEKQIREFTDSLMENDEQGNRHGYKHRKTKEVEIGCSHKRPFVNRLDLDYQNREKIEDLHHKIREGHSRLDLWKGFWKEEYDYDPNGNITQKRNGWGEIDYQYNPANQLTQVGNRTYQYDQNGNLTKEVLGKSFIDYQYNFENRLIKASDQLKHPLNCWKLSNDVSYGYDALGRRVKKEIDPAYGHENEVEYYIYNGLGLNVLAEYQIVLKHYGRYGVKGEIDQVKEYYYGNGNIVASREIEKPHFYHWGWDHHRDINFYHQDVLGSVVMLTDKYGQVAEKYQYDIWGKAYDGRFKDRFPGWSGRNDNVYGFTGQRYQPELGVYAFAYRDYSPRTMRWLTEDPVRDGLNWYRYCGGDPVNYIDSTGLKIEVNGTEEQKSDYEEAKQYIEQSERGKELISNLEDRSELVTVNFHDEMTDSYDPVFNEVNWNPNAGLEVGDGEIQTPALQLAHELGHAEQDVQGELRGKTVAEIEQANLTKTETVIANELGEPTRSNYDDVQGPILTKGPTSNDPAKN